MTIEAKNKSRRGLTLYKENPFIEAAATNSRVGTKRLTNTTKDRMMIVSETGEIMAPAGFHQIIDVDKTQFVKLFINGVSQFKELTKSGHKVYEILYRIVQENVSQDKIYIHYDEEFKEIYGISRSTFDRGMKEVLEKQFIAESTHPGLYFLNIDYMFNGDRLAFIKEYRLKSLNIIKEQKTVQQELEDRGQQRLTLDKNDS